MRLVIGAFCFGLMYSLVVVRYMGAVGRNQPWRAGGYDVLIGLLAAAPLQMWAISGSSWKVLAGEILGSAVGTFEATRRGWGAK